MARTSTDLTPLDIAGRNKSNDAALLWLQYFEKNFDIIEDVFHKADQERKVKKKVAHPDTMVQPVEAGVLTYTVEDLEYPWTIHRTNADLFTLLQHSYARVFYWAAFYGEKTLCQMFLKRLNTSPFLKLFRRQNVIAACIKGGQQELLEYLIKGTNENSSKKINKYNFVDPQDMQNFIVRRQQKDDCGNNSMHYAFEISDIKMRYKIVKLLIDEEVGELHKSNRQGQMPYQMEHTQPLTQLPPDI